MLRVVVLASPIFALIALGWVFRWRGWIAAAEVATLNDFVFRLLLPALMFLSATNASLASGQVPLAFFAGCLPVYAAGIAVGRRRFRLPLAEAGLFGLNSAFGNTVLLGIPLVLAVLGKPGLEMLLGIIALHAVSLLLPAIVLAEVSGNPGKRAAAVAKDTAVAILRNPIMLAVLAGTAWGALLPPLPQPLHRTLEMLGAGATPMALFCLGAGLSGNAVGGGWTEPLVGVAMKLFVMPTLVWAASRGLGLSPLGTAVAVVTAGLPTGPNAVVLARRYTAGGGSSGAIALFGTVLSVGTLALILYGLRPE